MLLGFYEIRRLCRELTPPLVEGLTDSQLLPATSGGVAEGACVELRIGKIFRVTAASVPVLRRDDADGLTRFVPDVTPVDSRCEHGDEFDLRKGDSVLIETIERIHLPCTPEHSFVAIVQPRFSLVRMGVSLLRSDADPGYSGPIVVCLSNLGLYDRVRFGVGSRIAKLRFARTAGESPPYVGRFGGKPGHVLEQNTTLER